MVRAKRCWRFRFSVMFLVGLVTVSSLVFGYARYKWMPQARITIDGPVVEDGEQMLRLRLTNTSGSEIAVYGCNDGSHPTWAQRETATGWANESYGIYAEMFNQVRVEARHSITWTVPLAVYSHDSRPLRIGVCMCRFDEDAFLGDGKYVWSPPIDFSQLAKSPTLAARGQ